MICRILVFVALLSPCAAKAQFSLAATQIGADGEAIGDAHDGTCTEDACRATLPVAVADDVCVLNVRVGAPERGGTGPILFAAGPCRSGRRLAVTPYPAEALYHLDRFGAATASFDVPFQAGNEGNFPNNMDDGVVHPFARVRLDIIATAMPGR